MTLAAKKVHRLDGDHNLPFHLIAISYPENLLKAAWAINTRFKTSLKESSNPIVALSSTFPVFEDSETLETIAFSLIANKSAGGVLVKELPNIDFILELSGTITSGEIQKIIKELKEIKGISAAIEINPKKIKRNAAFNPL